MKRIKYLLIFLAIFFISISNAYASNKINSINVETILDENGNGKITEVWDMVLSEGTEVYKPMGDLGNSKITNFRVIDEQGNIYTSLSNWNTSGTLSSKAYKNGINKTSDGIELCWGMSSYGHHTYIISYDVSNMIYNTNDSQVLYWKFINDSMDPAPKNFSVIVKGPIEYENTLDVWGYGYKGYAYVSNGYIAMSNEENHTFRSNEYGVLLVKYPLNTFDTTNSYSSYKEFNDFYEKAEEGAFINKTSIFETILNIIIGIISFIFQFGIWIFIVIMAIKATSPDKYEKKEIDYKNLNNFRDIPCNKDIMKAYLISEIYGINKKKEDLLGAILLKWLKDKKISIVKQEKKTLLGGVKEITAIQLQNNVILENKSEQELYDIMKKASGDMLLEENELKKWCSNNYSKFFKWFDTAKTNTRDEYINEGHIVVDPKKKKHFTLDDHLYEEATKLAGLKKFLNEFSRIKEKQPIEVNLWEYYLIYAQIFGIAKEVSKQFKDLYPELIDPNSNSPYSGLDYGDIIWINSITTSSVSAASAARSAAQSYSSGGGGFSSGGGGGGSFGGGSGGGTR